VDDADLYFQTTRSEGWSLEEGIVKSGSFSIDQGVGVRAVSGEKTAFAYSDDISMASLLDAARTVRSIAAASRSASTRVPARKVAPSRSLYADLDPILSLDSTAKVDLLGRVEALARARDPRVVQVMAGLASEHDVVLIARADGTLAADVRPLVRLSVTVIAEHKGRREMGSGGGGGRWGLERFDDVLLRRYVDEAVDAALTNLEARPAPAGEMTVVLGPGWPGVLLHEAVGHGLEGDFNRKGSSAFSGRIGQRVAAPGVTVLDDGTLADRRGSLNVDDEGCASQRNVLIEDGILRGYIQDAMNARLMGVKPTGNGRRESYAHLPMPRMTNTYMGRRTRPPRNRGEFAQGFVRHQLRRRAGGHHLGQICVLDQPGLVGRERQTAVPGERCHAGGQWTGCADSGEHDRQRHGPGQRGGHVRQGRAERAGGRGPADLAHRRPHRGGNCVNPWRLGSALGASRFDTLGQDFQRLHGILPAQTRIRDALTQVQALRVVLAWREFLRTGFEVAFNHHPKDLA